MSNTPETKPVVQILVIGLVPETVLQAIRWGLEEEGIPAETHTAPPGDVNTTGKKAARMSKLNVGLAISREEAKAVLHHRDLPEDRPLFVEPIGALNEEALRRLGCNAARLVKGNPLVFEKEDNPFPPERTADHQRTGSDALGDLVTRIVRETLQQAGCKPNGKSPWNKKASE